jgi:hypothetical protein
LNFGDENLATLRGGYMGTSEKIDRMTNGRDNDVIFVEQGLVKCILRYSLIVMINLTSNRHNQTPLHTYMSLHEGMPHAQKFIMHKKTFLSIPSNHVTEPLSLIDRPLQICMYQRRQSHR